MSESECARAAVGRSLNVRVHFREETIISLVDMSMSEADRVALTQICEVVPDLDRWRLRVQVTEEPETSSDLAVDDEIFPRMAITEIARWSLAFSGEHLWLALDALRANQIYPSSHFTVLRSALVGVSRGVWILRPDDRMERRERGFAVIAEMHAQMGKHYDSLEGLSVAYQDRSINRRVGWIAVSLIWRQCEKDLRG